MIEQVRLTGITKKGKERVKQHGSIWTVDQGATLAVGQGEQILLRAGSDWRWVKVKDDPNFIVERIED